MTQTPRRIAVISTSFPAGPGDSAGHFVATEACLLAEAGSEVVVIVPSLPSDRPPCLDGPGHCSTPRQDEAPTGAPYQVVRVPAGDTFGPTGAMARLRAQPRRMVGAARFVVGARRTLRQLGPFDLMVAHWLIPSAWPIAVGFTESLEIVIHGSDAQLLLSLPQTVRHRLLGTLVRRGASFRFVSKSLRDALVREGPPGMSERASVRPAAIQVPDLPSRIETRIRLGIRPETTLVVVAGRLVPSKRIEIAVSAATLVPRTRVVILGDGPERATISARFPAAEFVGALPRPEALRWILAADLLVSASRLEGAPTVIREARLLGVPVVTVPAGDAADWAAVDSGIIVISAAEARTRVDAPYR
ncbi:MAG: glycosyltransferase family 4 protein [Polyangiaceae bacterium]|nr:glycosyltransferase family 4 protein [Polyangiaceae bacterium]